jgi:hypothetical protein
MTVNKKENNSSLIVIFEQGKWEEEKLWMV